MPDENKESNPLGQYVLDEHGEPQPCADLLTWGRWLQSAKRHVKQDTIGDVRISTVFLGLDHGWPRGAPPVLWETMIFGGPHDGYQERYSSRAAAEAGHRRAVELVIEGE